VRVVPAADYAYALLARGWDERSRAPTTLIPVRTKTKLSVKRGATLTIALSAESLVGDCAAHEPLAQEEADFITERVFPGAFANQTYDAATCTTRPRHDDGGADGSP
jgi:hypothetical protein